MRARVRNQLIPDTTVSVSFERRRPPLEVTDAARKLAAHAQWIYRGLGRPLRVTDVASGGGTDAAFAALETDAPVIEGFGPVGYGAHSDEREYIELDSLEPRLYLLARMVMDVARGETGPPSAR